MAVSMESVNFIQDVLETEKSIEFNGRLCVLFGAWKWSAQYAD